MSTSKVIDIYTDGSCWVHKPEGKRPGGWSTIIRDGNEIVSTITGGEFNTTCNRMEMTAALKGLKFCSRFFSSDTIVRVYSDSKYLVRCFQRKWYVKWERDEWLKGLNGRVQPVKNQDLWKELLEVIKSLRSVGFFFVKGHNGNVWNEECDCLAKESTKRMFLLAGVASREKAAG